MTARSVIGRYEPDAPPSDATVTITGDPIWKNMILGYGEEDPQALLANPKNHRVHPRTQYQLVASLMRSDGWVGPPVLVNRRSGYMFDGHLRVKIALDQEQPRVPCAYYDLSPETELKAITLLDYSSSIAGIDPAILAQNIADLPSTDLAPDQAQALRDMAANSGLAYPGTAGSPIEDVDPDIDGAELLRARYGVQVGQLWQLGRHALLCGDSTDAACIARLMRGDRATMAWFDPPFGKDLKPQRRLTGPIAGDGNAAARLLWAAFLPLLQQTLTTPGVAFLCQNWTEFPWTLPLVGTHLTIKSKIVWQKTQWGIGYYTRPQHEDILYCWNGEPARPQAAISDVWEVARAAAPEHAAEKPVALSRMAIEFASAPGDIVIDWFSGLSGSLIACEQSGRIARSAELNPNHVAVSLDRWERATGIAPVRS